MISVPSTVDSSVAFPSLATLQETIAEYLDQVQQWSDNHFDSKYRDAAETLLYGLILLACCTAIWLYVHSNHHLCQSLGYWLAAAEQQYLVESGQWLNQRPHDSLLPISKCLDDCWTGLASHTSANSEILSYEMSVGAVAAME